MKKLIIVLFAMLISLPMAGQAAEDKEMIKSEKFTLEQAGGELSINKFFLGDEIAVEIVDKSGNKLLEMKGIGTQDKLFSLMGKATSLAVADVTGDQVPEVLASALYTFFNSMPPAKNSFRLNLPIVTMSKCIGNSWFPIFPPKMAPI
jgi:hypothetical protein